MLGGMVYGVFLATVACCLSEDRVPTGKPGHVAFGWFAFFRGGCWLWGVLEQLQCSTVNLA
jgi:hypothetical protein